MIDTTPVPIAEKVKPVPAATVLADGSVMVYEPVPLRSTILRYVCRFGAAWRHQNKQALDNPSGDKIKVAQKVAVVG
jgi:hypothetical protein